MKAFLAGLGIGVGLGILFAPMSGEETRNNLTQRANDLNDQARDFAARGRDQLNRGVQAARDIADRFSAQGTNAGRSNAGATGTEGV